MLNSLRRSLLAQLLGLYLAFVGLALGAGVLVSALVQRQLWADAQANNLALARSIGIPTKICAGLVFQDDGFYYHAWNEVFIGGQWYPIDSTLNRIEMDAAHIKLAEGSLEAQTDIVGMIGTLKVEILDLEYKE